MSFGGFCPLPLRLRDSAADGWTAADFLRLTADLAAASRSLPFAVLRIHRSAGGEVEILDYLGRHSPALVPEIAATLSSVAVVWPKFAEDDTGLLRPLRITHAQVTLERETSNLSSAAISAGGSNRVAVWDDAGGELTATVVVHARWGAPARVEDYGGSPDKKNSEAEDVPYAYQWYQEIGASLGSAFGQQTSGSVHARRLALSRVWAAVDRADERARANTVPGTADALLGDWAQTLQVPVSTDDPNWLVRNRCATKFAALSGQSLVGLEASLVELLGDRFVGIRTFDVDDAPGAWPDYFDLGGGVWASTRSKILVDVVPPADTGDREFSSLMNVQFVRLMDLLTPAWCVFDWTIIDSGFFLDESPLDFTGL